MTSITPFAKGVKAASWREVPPTTASSIRTHTLSIPPTITAKQPQSTPIAKVITTTPVAAATAIPALTVAVATIINTIAPPEKPI